MMKAYLKTMLLSTSSISLNVLILANESKTLYLKIDLKN